MQNNEQKKKEKEEEPITIIMNYEQNIQNYICYLNDSLEKYVLQFAKLYNINYSYIYALYNSNSLYGLNFKQHISEIITEPDKKEKRMSLLIYIFTEMNKTDLDEIRIILAIESIEIIKYKGERRESILDIIKYKKNPKFKLDINNFIFKYKDIEIDSNQKFDDIASKEDKKNLHITIIANYKIPLIVEFVNKKNRQYYKCFLKDKISDYVNGYLYYNKIDINDCDLYYENKKFENYQYKIFYEILSKDKIQKAISGENIINHIKNFESSDNLNKTNTPIVNDKEKRVDTIIPVLQTQEKKIKIRIKVVLKCCIVRCCRSICQSCKKCKREISCCCNKQCCSNCCKSCKAKVCTIISILIGLVILFCVYGLPNIINKKK